jgi:hypothetical protein
MRITRQPDRLVLRDRVAPFWGLGLFLIAGGLVAIAMPLGLASNAGSLRPWERLASVVIGSGVVLGGLWWLGRNPASRVDVLVRERRLRLTRLGVGGREVEEIGFDEIEAVHVEQGLDQEGGAVYRPAARRRSGGPVPLSLLWRHDPEDVRSALAAVAEAAGVPVAEPAAKTDASA